MNVGLAVRKRHPFQCGSCTLTGMRGVTTRHLATIVESVVKSKRTCAECGKSQIAPPDRRKETVMRLVQYA